MEWLVAIFSVLGEHIELVVLVAVRPVVWFMQWMADPGPEVMTFEESRNSWRDFAEEHGSTAQPLVAVPAAEPLQVKFKVGDPELLRSHGPGWIKYERKGSLLKVTLSDMPAKPEKPRTVSEY